MRFSTALSLVAAAGVVSAQRPANESICDYYTTALLKTNNATNQYTLLTLLVNTAVIGNYTKPNVGVAVTGILNPGMYKGESVNLLPYFDGGLKSANNNGMPMAVNFLDGGGAAPLKMNKPADNQSSAQYTLLTHLYSYFGNLLMCSSYGEMGFPAYAGDASQASVHRYMDLTESQIGYFIQEVGLAAASFGVADSDVKAVGMALTKTFGYRCSPAATVVKAQGAQLQAICQAPDCPLASGATCSAYPNDGVDYIPMVANGTLAMGEGTNSTSVTAVSTPAGASTPAASSPMASTPAGASTPAASSPAASQYTGAAAPTALAGYGVAAAGVIAAALAL